MQWGGVVQSQRMPWEVRKGFSLEDTFHWSVENE